MEDLSLEWPPAISSLEPLRPLSPDELDHDDIADLGISVGKLSRSQIAGKLLDHLDELTKEGTLTFKIPIFRRKRTESDVSYDCVIIRPSDCALFSNVGMSWTFSNPYGVIILHFFSYRFEPFYVIVWYALFLGAVMQRLVIF